MRPFDPQCYNLIPIAKSKRVITNRLVGYAPAHPFPLFPPAHRQSTADTALLISRQQSDHCEVSSVFSFRAHNFLWIFSLTHGRA